MPPLLCLVATSPPAAPAHVSTTSAAAYTARAADVSDIGRARSALIDTAIAALATIGGAGGHDGAFFLRGDAWMPDTADRVRLEITGFTQIRGVARLPDDACACAVHSDRTARESRSAVPSRPATAPWDSAMRSLSTPSPRD
ncbi:MAG: hypothetical protein KF817_05855 [Phycisphaeraceae bacterium]|nr:hypothetical protein [Phycisphaeraceae bacterium]